TDDAKTLVELQLTALSVMILPSRLWSKPIVSPLLALLSMVSRSDPGPESKTLLTTNVLGTVRSSRTVSLGTKCQRGHRIDVRVDQSRTERSNEVNNMGLSMGEKVCGHEIAPVSAHRPSAEMEQDQTWQP